MNRSWVSLHRLLASASPLLLLIAILTLAQEPALASPGMVGNLTVSVSPAATAYQNGSGYNISFVATDGIDNSGYHPITIVGPPGTSFAWIWSPSINDHTNPTDSTRDGDVSVGPLNNIAYISGIHDVAPGDYITLWLQGTNPPAPGNYTLTVATDDDPNPATSAPYPILNEGYWLVGSDGGIFTFGSAVFYGSTGNLHLSRPVVGITPTADRRGYWLDASDGGVFSFGDTRFYGSIPGLGIEPAGSGLPHSLDAPIVGMVPSIDDRGYFMVASDGGVFAFGDAKFKGSCPGIGGCNGSAVAVMPDATGHGYWLVTTEGRVYAFGDARNLGGPGNTGYPITSAVRTPDGRGYWILDSAGDVHAYGDAAYFGDDSDYNTNVNQYDNRASAIFTDALGDGYGIATQKGGLHTFGGVPDDGDMSNTNLNGSIIAASGF